MNRVCFLLLLVLAGVSCKKSNEGKKEKEAIINVSTFNYKQLKPLLHKNDEKVYVINFWATWCVPCVKELPAFEKLYDNYKDKNVEVVLVSLDFSKQIESNLIPFIKEKKLKSKIVHFEDKNEQFWIKDIAENWTGSIPATLIYNGKKRKFYEKSFDYEELQSELQTFLN
ncbi:TlpA family protein disulfide reductase [Tenacibaculum halocynthiae]|uniref:TlpA family protein disulfide reductase n=1 Tax=Tenacibaculum halocynthiae TaxID=1254437 RepID=UPI003D64C89E